MSIICEVEKAVNENERHSLWIHVQIHNTCLLPWLWACPRWVVLGIPSPRLWFVRFANRVRRSAWRNENKGFLSHKWNTRIKCRLSIIYTSRKALFAWDNSDYFYLNIFECQYRKRCFLWLAFLSQCVGLKPWTMLVWPFCCWLVWNISFIFSNSALFFVELTQTKAVYWSLPPD